MLNNSGESGHPCLVTDLRGNAFSFSPLRIMFAYHIWPLLCWGVFFYANFLKSFNHKWVLNFITGFFCIYWDYNMVLSFSLLIWCITLTDLRILKNPCIPGINPGWSWCMNFWFVAELFAKILLRIFASMFISDIGL